MFIPIFEQEFPFRQFGHVASPRNDPAASKQVPTGIAD